MDKAIIIICTLCLFICCKKQNECPPRSITNINPSFINWSKPYPENGIGYMRYKSNKGLEESLIINRDLYYREWYLQDDPDCFTKKGEWRKYNLMSSIYSKKFEIYILQHSSTETLIGIVNRNGGMDEGGIIFSSDKSHRFKYNPCDTCLHLFNNYSINNKLYDRVIKMYCPKGARSSGSESVKEIYFAEGYGIVQYTCSDSTVWNIVN